MNGPARILYVRCDVQPLILLLVFLYSLAAGLWPGARAAEIKDLSSEFIVDFWQTDQGLPDNFITTIAQSPDGYIWAGTFSGLARFNGSEFVVFDSANTRELPDSRVIDLTVDAAGRLWIRSQSGHFSYWHNGRFRLLGEPEGLPVVEFPTVSLDQSGNFVWARDAKKKEYLRFDGDRFQPALSKIDVEHEFGQGRDREGYAVGVNAGKLYTSNPNRPRPVDVPNLEPRLGWRIKPSRDGGVFVISPKSIAKFREGEWRDFGPLPLKTDSFEGFIEDHSGNFWIGLGIGETWRLQTNGLLTRFKLGGATITQPGNAFLEDAEKNLWIGTGGAGLLRVKPRLLKSFDSSDGLASDVVRSVAAGADGTIWLATVNSIDCFSQGVEKARKHHPEIELPWRVCAGRDGGVWVGTFGEGLFHFKGREWNRYRPRRGMVAPPMLRLLETQSGEMFAGSSRGLFRVRDDELQFCEPPGTSRPLDVRALADGPSGELYVGLNGGGVVRKNGDEWSSVMSYGQISALAVDHENTLWIGIEGKGLSRCKNGVVFSFPENAFNLPRAIGSITEDDAGRLWFGSNQGIYCAELKELNGVANGARSSVHVLHYDRSDGMGSSECTSGAGKSPDGRLWFATMSGVTVIDPQTLPRNPRPPPIVIEQILLDDKISSTRADAGFTIPPGLHRLEIRFAGLSFTAPDRVRYRYRLQGYDADWVEAGNRGAAYYTGIAPGEYRFEVRAANNDGVWNNVGATLQLIARPYFWQRASFQIAVIILLGVGAAALARYWAWLRVRQRLAELERRHALDKERGRISRDLHDSLGADLSQLALWSELALQAKDRPAVMAERARDVSELTREVIQNVEEIVWTLNPKNDSVDNFAAYLCEFSERVVTRAGLRFRWEAEESIPAIPLASDVRHHLFLATKEALNNIVKHASASEVRVGLAIEGNCIVIAIADDGRGFAVETAPANGGNGVGNMRDRVGACGGSVAIESPNGRGTSIRLRVPLPQAMDK